MFKETMSWTEIQDKTGWDSVVLHDYTISELMIAFVGSHDIYNKLDDPRRIDIKIDIVADQVTLTLKAK